MIAYRLRISFPAQLLLLEHVHSLGKCLLDVEEQERFPDGSSSLENCASGTFCVSQHPRIRRASSRGEIHGRKHLPHSLGILLDAETCSFQSRTVMREAG